MRRNLLALLLLAPLLITSRDTPGPPTDGWLPLTLSAGQGGYAPLAWTDLIPPGWDPMGPLRELDVSHLSDNDPRAIAALEQIRQAWDEAPVEPSLDGRRVRLPGFAIPLDHQGEQAREYLLVPYFGACIHAPPPPANQMIHVITREAPDRLLQTFDPIWVSGTLRVGKTETGMGKAGYRLIADTTRPYVQ